MKNLYEFQDLQAKSTQVQLMPEALTFGGINIDKELAGYRTLNVSGREDFTRSLNTAKSTSDGELFISSKLDIAEITIKYQLNADSIDEFNKRYTQLKYLLQGDEQPFYFADENEFVRYGTVTNLKNDSTGSILTTGSITIKMTNPYRHGQVKNIKGNQSLVMNDPQLIYYQPVDKLTMTVLDDTQIIDLNINNDYNLTMIGNYKKGSIVIVDLVDFNIFINGVSYLSNIDINKTNIFEAKVKNGDMLTSKQASSLSLSYRVRLL